MSTPPEGPRPLSPTEVAQRLGISRRTVARWTERGILPAFVLPNGQRRYLVPDVEAALRRYEPGEHHDHPDDLDDDADPEQVSAQVGAA